MKKNLSKIGFDLVMAVLLFCLYSKTAIGIHPHEVIGLVIGGVVIIHLLINWRWIGRVTAHLVGRRLPGRTRFGYIINLLLLAVIILIIVSGAMVSQTILLRINGQWLYWKVCHYCASAALLILLGIHLGLHLRFIMEVCTETIGKKLRLPPRLGRALGTGCLVVLLAFGCCNLVASDFLSWLTMPFSVTSMQDGAGPAEPIGGDPTADPPTASADGAVEPERPSGLPTEPERRDSLIYTILSFFSITLLFAFLTDLLLRRAERRQRKEV